MTETLGANRSKTLGFHGQRRNPIGSINEVDVSAKGVEGTLFSFQWSSSHLILTITTINNKRKNKENYLKLNEKLKHDVLVPFRY